MSRKRFYHTLSKYDNHDNSSKPNEKKNVQNIKLNIDFDFIFFGCSHLEKNENGKS